MDGMKNIYIDKDGTIKKRERYSELPDDLEWVFMILMCMFQEGTLRSEDATALSGSLWEKGAA